MTADLYNLETKKTEKVKVPKEIFEAKINPFLMAQAVRVYLANQRQGTLSAKTRGEVKGSGRKIYRQKGTGNARHGDRYAPIFVGGGVAFPPKPRDFSLKISKKAKKAALFSALTKKFNDNKVIFLKGLEKIKPKTKEGEKVLKEVIPEIGGREIKILLVIPEKTKNILLAMRNLKGVEIILANLINTYTVLKSDKIIFLDKSLEKIKEVFLKKESEDKKINLKNDK